MSELIFEMYQTFLKFLLACFRLAVIAAILVQVVVLIYASFAAIRFLMPLIDSFFGI